MKIKHILGLSFLMASLFCTSAILAEENDSTTKEATQETTVESETTQENEKIEQSCLWFEKVLVLRLLQTLKI